MTLNKNTFLYRIRFPRPGTLCRARTVHNSKTFFLSFCYWLCSISLHTQSTATERMSAGAFLTVLISRRLEATGSVKLAENAKKKSSVPVCVCFVHGWKMNNNFFIWLPWKESKKGRRKGRLSATHKCSRGKSLPSLSTQVGLGESMEEQQWYQRWIFLSNLWCFY